jgi:glycosyltransferase involved in cell wall biosynthesis
VIPNGVNEAHFSSASGASVRTKLGLGGATILGFTGFVRDWHGVDRVIHWMATPDVATSVHLLVVGDGPARHELERLALELGLSHRVIFTGVVSRERVPEYVAAFDIALQPAAVEYASPLKLFEYLAAGKAIVAPRQSNLEEVLVDGKNVLFFDGSRPTALADALSSLVANPLLREALAAGAAATIAERRLTWLDSARRVSAVGERLRNEDRDSTCGYRDAN